MKKTERAKELRRKAEEKVASQPVPAGNTDLKRLLYKLRIENVELQVQNEELQQTIQTVQAHKTYMQNVINMTPAGYFRLDKDDCFVEVNDAWLIMHGYGSRDEIIGKHFSILQVDSTSDSALNHLEELHSGKPIPLGDFSSLRKDGTVVHHVFSAHPVMETGRVVGFEWFIIDITKRKKAEEEREKCIVNLQKVNQEQEQFIYTFSHDLKSPLITISGFCDVAKNDIASGDQEQVNNSLDIISNAAKRMGQLLNELLQISRVGVKINPSEIVSLKGLIKEASESVSGVISENNTTLEIEPRLPDVKVDRQYFLQLLENLITNASRYTRSANGGSHVKIGVTRNEEELICYVKDNGMGIESQYLDKVFGLFEKLDAESDSTGVGLAIVKRIIESHGGRIWAESEGLGHGTTFFFTLPEA